MNAQTEVTKFIAQNKRMELLEAAWKFGHLSSKVDSALSCNAPDVVYESLSDQKFDALKELQEAAIAYYNDVYDGEAA